MGSLSTEDLDSVRRIVLDRVVPGRGTWSLERIASEADASESLLRAEYGRAERLVDEVVAGVLRRSRPIIRPEPDPAVDITLLIADLVRCRLVVHQHIRAVWHLIGQGEASTQEFDILRSTLLAGVECGLGRRLDHLAREERVEAVKLVDGWLNLASVNNLRSEHGVTFGRATEQLSAEVATLLESLDVGRDRTTEQAAD